MDPKFTMCLAKVLKMLREKTGTSQGAFAKKYLFSQTQLSQFEHAVKDPTARALWAYSRESGVALSEIFKMAEKEYYGDGKPA